MNTQTARRKWFQRRSKSAAGEASAGPKLRNQRPGAVAVREDLSPAAAQAEGVKVSKLASGLSPRNDLPISVQLSPKADPFCGEEEDNSLPEAMRESSSSWSASDEEEEGSSPNSGTGGDKEPAATEEYGKVDRVEFTEPDVYGQRHPIETKALLESKLISFEQELEAMPDHKKLNLHKAMKTCPKLLTKKFKLQFLRCECFNERRAAKRYAKYWDKRFDIFGPDRAFLPMTQSEALKDDALALSKGALTLPGTKDSSGRYIIYVDPTRQDIGAYSYKSMTRAIWYIFHAALEDEETQKKGVVFVVDLRIVNLSLLDKDLALLCAGTVQGCLPVRLSGIHGCSPPRIFSVMFPILKVLLGDLRKRVRLHAGPSLERIQSELAKYSLTKEVIPTDLGGKVKINHEHWLQQRSLPEQINEWQSRY